MEKQLPHNMEAESGVLGSILIDPQAIALVVDFLQPEDFYRNAHRIIFSAMLSLFEHHAPPDLITVCDVLERQGKLAEVGGPAYITSLVNHVPTSMHVEHYGHIVSKSALHRRLIQAASSIAALGFEEAEHALDTAEELIYGLGNRSIASEVSSAGTVFTEFFNQLEQLPPGGSVVGVPSGFHELDRMTRGFQRSDLIIMAARPAMGKCLSASMLIDNPMTGERLTIEEAVQRRLPFVYGIAPDEKIRPTAVSHWIDSGIKPCYRVQTRSGRTVEVTGHHPFLTVQGWVPLSELEVGRHIAVPGRLECFGGDDSMPLEKVRLLAYFMAGGGLTGGSPEFASTDPLIAEDFKQIIAHSFPELTIRQIQTTYTAVHLRKGVRNPLCQWLEELGLKGQYADQRFFPACVWRWGKRYLVEFLRVLVSCDGCIHLDTGTPVIEFTVTSQQLAADVQHAFLRVGIVSQFSSKTILYWGKRQAVWSVVISHPESVKRYQEEIGRIGEKSVRSAEYAKVLDYVDLQRTSGSDVYWDEIVSIEAIGDQPVYDLTVPDGANFIAQDIFVHNTSMCLSIAANAAIPFGRGVLLFSCEMSKVQIIQRLTGMLSGVNVQRLFTRQINEDEMEQVIAVGHTVDAASLWIDDTPALTIPALRSKLRRTLAEYHIDLVIVDYLQLMQAMIDGKRIRDRLQEVSEVARGLKNAAREFNLPILALAQLSRAVEGRADKRPQLSDLRECVVGSTRLIEARTGKWVPIEQIQPGDEVLGLGKQQKIGRFPVEQVWRTGTKPVFRLTTRTGRQITATADHRLLTGTGWKQLGEIASGERIATAMRLPEHGQEMPERADLCRLLGYMLGDGAYLKHRAIGFASYDPEAFEDVSTLMQERFPGVKAHSKPYKGEAHEAEFSYLYESGSDKTPVNPLRKWLRELGLIEQKDRCKHVPQWVFEAGKIGACQFLAGYLSTDGCVKRRVKDGRVIWEVRFDTVSRQLATDIQALLLRIGVIASIDRSKQKVKARQRLYRIRVSSIADNLKRFAEQVPARGEKGRLLQQFLEEDLPIQIDPGVFGLPPELSTYVAVRAGWRDLGIGMPRSICLEWAKQLKDPFLQEWGESDLLWEEVRSIELSRGSAEVFDISVPGCKNFIADGIVAHNSGELEQAADVVMFIHRDDYYAGFNRETGKSLSARPKTADIIIAKHRNGPIGDIMLGFEAGQTKFYNLSETGMED